MTVATTEMPAGGPHQRTDGGLYDILDLVLDRGLVIDVFVRVSLVGIELLRIDARVVVASVDTYLRFAEACNRADLEHQGGVGVPEMVAQQSGDGSRDELTSTLRSIDANLGALAPGQGDPSAAEEFQEEPEALQEGDQGEEGEEGKDGQDPEPQPEPARRGGRRRGA